MLEMKEIEKIYQIQGELLSESEAIANHFSLEGYKLSTLEGITKDLQWNPAYQEIVEIQEGLFKFDGKKYIKL